jgi:peptidoglycan/xylan/chitin deacetylase (PgdA/CDA1 family)
MKHAILNLMNDAGVFAPFRLANRGKALIVTYHRFRKNDDPLATSARELSRQLEYLTSNYRVVSLSELAGHLASPRALPSRLAAITIDDGYRDFYEVAFPVFRRYKVPAAVFIVTGFADQQTWMWTDKLRYILPRARTSNLEIRVNSRQLRVDLDGALSRFELAVCINSVLKSLPDEQKDDSISEIASALGVELPDAPPSEFGSVNWDQIREMDSAGIEIGSHTLTHPILTNVGSERLRIEVGESRERIEGVLGHRVNLFCYPNGNYNMTVQQEAARAGYLCAVTSEPGFNAAGANPLALRRIHTERDLAHFVQSTSGFEQAKSRLRRPRTTAVIPAYEH